MDERIFKINIEEAMKYDPLVGNGNVKKIDVDLRSLQKSEKRIWVKQTAKRKGHYRTIKCAKR